MDNPLKVPANLFHVLEQGDRRIQNIKEKAIILIGGTRIGKSGLFNLILNKNMVGRGKGKNIRYELMTDQEGQAVMSNAFKSETLAPNIKPNFTEEVSLVDMAGFGDTRDYVGIIGVSYFLKKVTQKVKEFKFVLVIDEFGMKDPTGKKLIDTFQGFINMFNFDVMTTEIKEKLKQSLAFVVTRSTSDNYNQDIKDAIEQLQDTELQVKNRQLITQLMRSVEYINRIEGFKAAKENLSPKEEEGKFFDRFDKDQNWQFFNLKEAEETIGQSLVSLPFSKEYEMMQEVDKTSFSAAMTSKTESYKEVQLIFNCLLNKFGQNWNNVIDQWEKTREYVPDFFKMKEPFEEIARFLDRHDVYNSEKTITTNFRSSYDPPSLFTAVNIIRTGYKETEKILNHDVAGDFNQKMTDISVVYANMMNIFKPFCTCEEDQKLLARLHYVIQRGLIECSSLYDLRQDIVHGVAYFLTDAIENAFEMKLKIFLEIFFKRIDSDLTPVILNSFDAIEEYGQLFRLYEQSYSEEQKDKLFIPKQKCSIDAAKAELYLKAGQKSQATVSLSKVVKTLEEISLHVTDSNEQTQIICSQLKTLQLTKRKMVLKMVNILTELPKTETFEPLSFAIELCKHMNFTKDACEIYENIIASSRTALAHKSQICLDYSNYLIYWGLLDQALQVLETKQSIETDDYDRYENTMNLISEFEDKRETYRQEFKSRSKSWRREPTRDDKLLEILSNIESVIPEDHLLPAK